MKKLDPKKLYHLNKSTSDLVQLLSPDINPTNIPVFNSKSGTQRIFNNELNNKGIDLKGNQYPELEDALNRIREQFAELKKEFKDVKRTKLDFNVAKIFHNNLDLARSSMIDYDFWQSITLFYLIEITKWRWEDNPEKSDNWYKNAKAIFGRSLGVTLNKQRYEEDKIISYTMRNQRINSYRYWWIGQRMYDPIKKYYYLDKLAEKVKAEESSVQDFLNHLEGNRLLSQNDRVSKIMADCILLSGRKFGEQEARDCFMRYNAFSSRLFMDADEKSLRHEICNL